jgi:hypothetical protein
MLFDVGLAEGKSLSMRLHRKSNFFAQENVPKTFTHLHHHSSRNKKPAGSLS